MSADITFPYRVCRWIAVETFSNHNPYEPTNTSVRVRPLPNQGVPTSLRVECDRHLRFAHPVGTVFAMQAKIIDHEGTPLIYSYFGWKCHVIEREKAEKMIANGELGFFHSAKSTW